MIKYRRVKLSEHESIRQIYLPYVREDSVTLEYDEPTEADFINRVAATSCLFPYIVCELDGEIVGYAYAHRYKERYGYRFCAELSVYVKKGQTGHGIGKTLYMIMIDIMKAMGYKNLYGIVTDPNPASFALHKSLGFTEAGRERNAGVKFGVWHDVVIFEKRIGDYPPGIGSEGPKRLAEIEDEMERIIESYN